MVILLRRIPNNKLLLDHYLDGAIEAEADAICDGEDVYIIGIMEHIEPCGIHSGDSNATLPVFNLGEFTVKQIRDHTKKIALALNTVGLMCLPPINEDPRKHFLKLRDLATKYNLNYLSMGMSGDYQVALECGATHIRIGTHIFGERN